MTKTQQNLHKLIAKDCIQGSNLALAVSILFHLNGSCSVMNP